MTDLELLIYCITGFFLSIFTGMAGGGAGFVTTPLAIFLGLSPSQAVTAGKFNGLAATFGGLSGMRADIRKVNRHYLILSSAIAFAAGLTAPYIIKSLDQDIYKKVLGILIILLLPFIWKKKIGIKTESNRKPRLVAGTIAAGASYMLLGIFSGGLGVLVNMTFMHFFNLRATEAIILKRWSQILLNSTIILSLLGSGLILWRVVLSSIIFAAFGSYIGGKIAIKKGNVFIMNITLALMCVSGMYLLFS